MSGDDPPGTFLAFSPEPLPLLQDREPRKACLVDLENESLEQSFVIPDREAVFEIVVRPVDGMPTGRLAVAAHR
jgi:hypothetical protein